MRPKASITASVARAAWLAAALAGVPIILAGDPARAGDAVGVLLDQARFWSARQNIPRALESLSRAERLAPADPAVLAVAAELRGGATPPTTSQVAYFTRLAATAGGWDLARDGLAELVRRDPAALDAQLAYATVLTGRAGAARADGVARLRALAARPEVASAARAALRQAQAWDGPPPTVAATDGRATLARDIAAIAGLDPVVARDRLLGLAGQPDPDGARGAAIAAALVAAGQADAAAEAIAAATAATPGPPNPAARVAYAAALLAAGDPDGAENLLPEATPTGLSDDQKATLSHVGALLAVRRADALGAAGRPAAGFDALAPFLAHPEPAVTVALGRLYLAAHRPRDALAVAEPALETDPLDAAARQVVVAARLNLRDTAGATRLARNGQKLTPRDPRAWLAAADLDRATGNREAAVRDLRQARVLRQDTAATLDGDRPAVVAAMLTPGEASPDLSAPPAAVIKPAIPPPEVEGGDGDPVVIRGHMLDTDATEVLPPNLLRARAAAALAAAGEPAAARPPFLARQVPMEPVLRAANSVDPEPPPPANPFRGLPATTRVADATPPTAAMAVAAGGGAPDPVAATIAREMSDLAEQPAPAVQTSLGFRGRSGTAGLGQLGELTTPLEATFSASAEGKVLLSVTPTVLGSGTLAGDPHTQSQFGTAALALRRLPGGGVNGLAIGRETMAGAGLDLVVTQPHSSVDVGATPLGFPEQNIVGGVQWAPEIADGVRLRLTGERRAVTDSVLSYGGARDPVTGQHWGGVTLSRGRADLMADFGTFELYAGGGGGGLEGHGVKWNTEIEAGAGGSFAVVKTEAQQLQLGLDLIYTSYDRNLSGFSLGQGGYFSPQNYFAAMVPATWRAQVTNDLTAELGGSAGVQTFRQDSSAYYPLRGDLQARLAAQQANPATAMPGVAASLPSRERTGFAGAAHGALDYRLTPAFHVGAKADYEHIGTWNQVEGLLYGRYLLGGETGP